MDEGLLGLWGVSSFRVLSLNVQVSGLPIEEVQVSKNSEDFWQQIYADTSPKVLLLNLDFLSDDGLELSRLAEAAPESVWLSEDGSQSKIEILAAYPQFFGFLTKRAQENQDLLNLSFEKVSEFIQERDFLKLLQSENAKLKSDIQSEKQKKEPMKLGLSRVHLRMKTLESALIEVLKARSIHEIEKALKASLSKLMPLEYVRVVFHQQTSLIQRGDDPFILKLPLHISDTKTSGWLILGLSKKRIIPEKDLDLLEEIAEITSLSVNRIVQLEASESLKKQWDATFDAISDPLALVDEDMKILRTNKAFAHAAAKAFKDLIGENALRIFFKDNPEIWQKPPPFNVKIQIQNKADGKSYSLVIHDLKFEMVGKNINLLLIKDLTDQMKIEKQIREKSKLVELGTIGSSIAHELNNPLAGMLSYIQLLLMDAKPGTEFHEDLKEMEEATFRCRDIVKNLLGFSRKQSHGAKAHLDLNELISQAIQLVELKSRFKKVKIEFQPSLDQAPFQGDQNSLVQAITHLLSNSVEALEELLPTKKDIDAHISVSLTSSLDSYTILISDNGPGILEKHLPLVINPLFTTKTATHHAGLGLTVAYSIFSEHNGSLEIESRPGQGVTAIISLPRPEIT